MFHHLQFDSFKNNLIKKKISLPEIQHVKSSPQETCLINTPANDSTNLGTLLNPELFPSPNFALLVDREDPP
jgi:hypothetical protein